MNSETNTDRREHHEVRKIFQSACELLMPVIEQNDKGFPMSNFAMEHMVREHFPELTESEAGIAVATVRRAHQEQRLQALLKR